MTGLLQQALARAGIVEPLDRLTQPVLGEREAEMARGHLLHRMCLVEDNEIIREEVSDAILLGIAQQGEEESVIEDKHIC